MSYLWKKEINFLARLRIGSNHEEYRGALERRLRDTTRYDRENVVDEGYLDTSVQISRYHVPWVFIQRILVRKIGVKRAIRKNESTSSRVITTLARNSSTRGSGGIGEGRAGTGGNN